MADPDYDLTIDTTDRDPQQCALDMKRALANDAQPSAFGEMRRRFLAV